MYLFGWRLTFVTYDECAIFRRSHEKGSPVGRHVSLHRCGVGTMGDFALPIIGRIFLVRHGVYYLSGS